MKVFIICSKAFYKDVEPIKEKYDEISGFSPIVINGDLNLIK